MPIILTTDLGETLTLTDDGEWQSDNRTLVDFANTVSLPIGDQYKADPDLLLAQAVAELLPGTTIQEVDRPEEEDLPPGAVP